MRTLGPGVRAGLWFQGCKRRCDGCISPESRDFSPEKAVSLDDVTKRLSACIPGADGVTISGGEPFEQPEALFELLRRVKALGLEDVLIYSGYTLAELTERHPEVFAEGLVAALVDGPFEKENTTDSLWRGSANQTLTLWKKEFAARYEGWTKAARRRLQWVRDGDGRFLVGIPRQEDVSAIKDILLWGG